jgi:hypothetical protein
LLKAAVQASLSFSIVALFWASAGEPTLKQPMITTIRHTAFSPQ